MDIQEYLNKNKDIQETLLNFMDNGTNIQNDPKLGNLIKSFTDRNDLKSFLHLITSLSNNHYRSPNFFDKLDQLLFLLKDQIKQTFSNFEIFIIFLKNKRLLLFLFENQIVVPDKYIANLLTQKKYVEKFCDSYFYPEIKTFFDNEFIGFEYQKENNFDKFEQMRKTGENESYICQLIRNDSIDEFITFSEKEKITFSKKIDPTTFETNSYLLRSHPTLIKYSAFYGSIQIFKYLHSKGAKLNPSLWIYAIHGRNKEIIQILIDNNILPKDKTYKDCYKESIRFHHNEIADFIKQNLLNVNVDDDFDVIKHCLKYYNYSFLPTKIDTNLVTLFNLCKFDYIQLVDLLLNKNKDLDINNLVIFKMIFVNQIPKSIVFLI